MRRKTSRFAQIIFKSVDNFVSAIPKFARAGLLLPVNIFIKIIFEMFVSPARTPEPSILRRPFLTPYSTKSCDAIKYSFERFNLILRVVYNVQRNYSLIKLHSLRNCLKLIEHTAFVERREFGTIHIAFPFNQQLYIKRVNTIITVKQINSTVKIFVSGQLNVLGSAEFRREINKISSTIKKIIFVYLRARRFIYLKKFARTIF